MAWRMKSLDDLKELYHRIQSRGVAVTPQDHSLSLGLYFKDPDGNGIEVYYELPRSQWHAQEGIFMQGERPRGQFPGPWDEVYWRSSNWRPASPRNLGAHEAEQPEWVRPYGLTHFFWRVIRLSLNHPATLPHWEIQSPDHAPRRLSRLGRAAWTGRHLT